jgi:xylulokinase
MGGEPLLVGIDVGTTNIKAVIFDLHGRLVAADTRKTPVHYPRPGWAYFRPQEIWDTTVAALRDAITQVEDPQRIAGLAVASMGESGVPIDAGGVELYDAIAWFDNRTEPQTRWLDEHIGSERIWSISGSTPQALFGLPKLMWLQEHAPDVLARATTWLHMSDYIAWRLTGVAATDYSLASRTLVLNLSTLTWERSLIEAAGVPLHIFRRSSGAAPRWGRCSPQPPRRPASRSTPWSASAATITCAARLHWVRVAPASCSTRWAPPPAS